MHHWALVTVWPILNSHPFYTLTSSTGSPVPQAHKFHKLTSYTGSPVLRVDQFYCRLIDDQSCWSCKLLHRHLILNGNKTCLKSSPYLSWLLHYKHHSL